MTLKNILIPERIIDLFVDILRVWYSMVLSNNGLCKINNLKGVRKLV